MGDPKVSTGDPSNGGIALQDGKCTGFASKLYGQYRYCGALDAAAYNGAGSVDCKCCASPPPAECTTAPKAEAKKNEPAEQGNEEGAEGEEGNEEGEGNEEKAEAEAEGEE